MIPFLDLAAGTAEVRHEIDAAVARVIDRGAFVLGPELEAFEGEFAAVLTNGDELASNIRRLRNYGSEAKYDNTAFPIRRAMARTRC